jgi:hypothetical protein
MLIKAVVRPINTQRFGLRMHLMNGKIFEDITYKDLLLIY